MSDTLKILQDTRTIAVLGAHPARGRAAHYVPAYLNHVGYRIIPVNLPKAGMELFGQPVLAHLTDIDEPVDMVDVFRRSDALPGHLDEILAMDPLPRVVWFQLGVRNDEVAQALRDAGITVVQDRCTMAEHQALGLG